MTELEQLKAEKAKLVAVLDAAHAVLVAEVEQEIHFEYRSTKGFILRNELISAHDAYYDFLDRRQWDAENGG